MGLGLSEAHKRKIRSFSILVLRSQDVLNIIPQIFNYCLVVSDAVNHRD